jgi:hypothetical protein
MTHHAASTIPPNTVMYVGTAARQVEPSAPGVPEVVRRGGATQYYIVDQNARSTMAQNATVHGPYVPGFFKPKY